MIKMLNVFLYRIPQEREVNWFLFEKLFENNQISIDLFKTNANLLRQQRINNSQIISMIQDEGRSKIYLKET